MVFISALLYNDWGKGAHIGWHQAEELFDLYKLVNRYFNRRGQYDGMCTMHEVFFKFGMFQ